MPQEIPGHVSEHEPGAPQLRAHPSGGLPMASSTSPLTMLPVSVSPACATTKGGTIRENESVSPLSALAVPSAVRRQVPARVLGGLIATLLGGELERPHQNP